MTSAGARIQQGISAVSAASSATANAVTIVVAESAIAATSQAVMSGNITAGGVTVMSSSASLSISGSILWTDSPGDDATYADVASAANEWADVAEYTTLWEAA